MSVGADGKKARPVVSAAREFWLRLGSALVMVPLALLLVGFGGTAYTLGVVAIAMLCLFEWNRIAARSAYKAIDLALALGLAAALLAFGHGAPVAGLALGAATIGLALFAALAGRTSYWLALGGLVIGLACLALLVLRQGEAGRLAVLVLVAVVWATDIAAYLVGRTLGGPKLWPAISPKKTWSGAVGGLLVGVGAGLGSLALAGVAIGAVTVTVVLVLGLATQVGDWLESAFKRAFAVKDTGTLIPGHGGALDRLDGLLAAAIAMLLMVALAGGSLTLAPGLRVELWP